MSDLIRLLPDSVANQIAAGEVIQRPASAVKELLENSIDSGATEIKIIIKDAGKTLIQIIDNGCGMSETDARMCFERHATSKIKKVNDLFAIRTMGFRGEALASIAAIAQVELKTKRIEDELATYLVIEGSVVKSQSACSAPNGTSIAIKNLFFNVPARRNFLKSNPIETKHIFDELYRIAIAHPQISFVLYDNNNVRFDLAKANLKQRIANVLSKNYSDKLVPLEQSTDVISISGFIGKPESAKKTRGEQFFFVNNRFIKHPYLNHAVDNAFDELIPEGFHPSYFIFFDINPQKIDINIHPTKTEVNFQDNKVIYNILKSTVKQSLGKFSLTPTIDFNVERSFDYKPPPKDYPVKQPEIKVNPDYNPFDNKPLTERERSNKENWTKLYQNTDNNFSDFPKSQTIETTSSEQQLISKEKENIGSCNNLFQLSNRFILANVESGLMLIDKQLAHERILYDKYFEMLKTQKNISQQELFPQTIEFNPSDAELFVELKDEIKLLGFDINEFGPNTFIVNGVPADLPHENVKDLLEGILENYKKNLIENILDKRINLLRSLAKKISVKHWQTLKKEEMQVLVEELFKCSIPETSPSGKRIIKIISIDELSNIFKEK